MREEFDRVTDVSFNMKDNFTLEILIRIDDNTHHTIILKPIKKRIEIWKI